MERETLLGLDFVGRLNWMREHLRTIRITGMLLIKVDGVLAATGYESEFEDMVAGFLMFIARGPRAPRAGGMA